MSPQKQILLVENDATLAAVLADTLDNRGYQIRVAHTGRQGIQMFDQNTPDLVLLDTSLPDATGFEVMAHIRQFSSTPVMMLSTDGFDQDKVQALERGADDYMVKPFHQEELLARITALLRRVSWAPAVETLLEVHRLRIDIARRHVTLNGEIVRLTPIEYMILYILVQRAGETVTYEELLNCVWGPAYEGNFSVLRVNVSRLRQKLEQISGQKHQCIRTVPRKGYCIPL
jgi:two-component system KDP operon response regulator KdpE